jgi:hypothetical protein
MARNLTELVRQAVGAKRLAPAFLCRMDFASGPLRVWSGAGDLEWNGDTFTGVGSYGGVSAVEETKKASANGIELSLSGVPSNLVNLAMADHYRGRRIRLWMALFDTDGGGQFAMMDNPIQIFGGRMDTMRISDSGDTSRIVVSCESRLIDMERPRERRYADADQQELYPGDRGFEYVASLADKEVLWGRTS